jgi:hypothetical protein
LEAESHKFSRGLYKAERVGLKAGFIANDFEFDKVGGEQLAGYAGGIHGLTHGVAACRVGQDVATRVAQQIPKRLT